jgi:DNA-binding MarR family transcriptional regulator
MTPIPLPEFADRLSEIFPVIMKELGRRREDEIYKGKITIQQFILLGYLAREDQAKMTELAEFMDVTLPAMTGIVTRLIRAGFAKRHRHHKDRRVVLVEITPKGRALVKRVLRVRRQLVLDIFGQVSEKDREDYLRVLTNVRDTLLRQRSQKK